MAKGKKAEPVVRYMSVAELAKRYGVHTATIYKWSGENGFPKPIKLSERVTRWRESEVLAYEKTLRR